MAEGAGIVSKMQVFSSILDTGALRHSFEVTAETHAGWRFPSKLTSEAQAGVGIVGIGMHT
jgi:hypothetical protein